MTQESVTPNLRISPPTVLAVLGFGAVVLFYLALLLPGQNIHGGTLTLYTLYFGVAVPPLCFAAGLVTALFRSPQRRAWGIWINVVGLLMYALWVSGALHKILSRA